MDTGELSLARDVTPGQWVIDRTTGPWHEVGALLPHGFAAYARIFHPAYRHVSLDDSTGVGGRVRTVEVPWAEVAAANGRAAHPAMDWVTITGSERYLHGDRQPGVWDEEPSEGSLPLAQNRMLVRLLQGHTTTPEACWFAIWEGFGDLEVPPNRGRLAMPNRPMLLFSGPIDAWLARQERDPFHRSASLWWPQDRAWCVATDVDLMSTYLGADERCVDELIADDALEAGRITIDQPTTWDKDAINAPADAA